jgi:hypothetical protein
VERGYTNSHFKLVRAGKLLCLESDQEEEYAAQRLDDDVHGMFARLSLGISLTHRQEILDDHIFRGMRSFVEDSDTILLPSSSYFHGDPVKQLEAARRERFIVTVGPFKGSEILRRRAESKEEVSRHGRSFVSRLVATGQTYEKQLELEVRDYWDTLVEIVRKFDNNMLSGQYNFWDFMAATGPLLYRRVWDDVSGQPRAGQD